MTSLPDSTRLPIRPTPQLTPLALLARRASSGAASTFASLANRNFRLFAISQLISNTGSWMLRIAQDWLVLSLTGSAADVGLTTAMQFLPTALLSMPAGVLVDRYPKRRILLCTYSGFSAVAAVLAILTLSGHVQAWQIQLTAAALGTLSAIDNPARQTLVNEMVGPQQLRNAISINSAVFQLGGILGPAASGVLISLAGSGWAFLITAISYTAPLAALIRVRVDEQRRVRPLTRTGQLRAGLSYARSRGDLLWPITLVGVFAVFTANLPVTLASYARTAFHTGPGGYAVLSATVAIGSVLGALVSARQPRTRIRTLVAFAATLACLYSLAAVAPTQQALCPLLLAIGATTVLLYTSTSSTVQLATSGAIRGRVMGIYFFAFVTGAAAGGPLVGGIDQHLGPHAGMLLAGALPGTASLLIAAHLARRTREPAAGTGPAARS